jgi:hypothetical protein
MALAKPILYESDYALWIDQTIQALRDGRISDLDLEHLIEEVEDLGKSQRQALKSNLRILLMHLLKWQYQSKKRSSSWKGTIQEHRSRILDILEDSPSLKTFFVEVVDPCYAKAQIQAADETELDITVLPGQCPYAINEILDEAFWPDR